MCVVVEFQNYVDCGRRKVEAIVWECPIIGLDLWESPAPAHYPGVFDVEISSPPGLTKWPRCLTARVIPEPGHWWSEERREETLQTSDHSDQVTKWMWDIVIYTGGWWHTPGSPWGCQMAGTEDQGRALIGTRGEERPLPDSGSGGRNSQ